MTHPLTLPAGWRVLVLPGWQNSGAGHWQSRWEAMFPTRLERVEQADWDWPRRGDWMARLDEVLLASEAPAVLMAHSLGCQLVAAWAGHSRHAQRVRAALLVAPPDTARPDTPPQLAAWRNIPRERLPWAAASAEPPLQASLPAPAAVAPATAEVICSDDDPFCSPGRAREMAATWGLPVHALGPRGHINADSGLGDWPEGLARLQRLVDAAAGAPSA
jgi:predicted alpha/beta hydrolase family esterase